MKKIKRFLIFLGYLILVFIPLIIGFVFHIKAWWQLSIIGIIQIVFILLFFVIIGGVSLARVFNNNDGY